MRSQVQQDPRIKRRLSCDLFFNGGRQSGIVLNVSRGGLFVQTSVAAGPGENVAVDLNRRSGENLEIDATVVWKRIVQAELMGVAHGGVGLEIKRASPNYYEFVEDALEVKREAPAEPAGASRYYVRVKLAGQPRSRALEVFAESEEAAGRQALETVGEDWSVIEIEEQPSS